MGKEGLRYAAKVELDKDAGTLPYLHVSTSNVPSNASHHGREVHTP